MRIAIFSDVHGNDHALQAVIDDLKREMIEDVIFLGDLVVKGPNPKNSLKLIKSLNLISCIKGNTDSWYEEIPEDWKPVSGREKELYEYYLYSLKELNDQDTKYLSGMQINASIMIKGLKILCVHGSPRSQSEAMVKEVDGDKIIEMLDSVNEEIILCGHSHKPSILKINGKVIVNVGSVGMPSDRDTRASYVILDIAEKDHSFEFKRVKYNVDRIVEDAKTKDFPSFDKYENAIRKGIAI